MESNLEMSVNRSVMGEYSKMIEEAEDNNKENHIIETLMAPKLKKINSLLSQYFVHHGYMETDYEFQSESQHIHMIGSSTEHINTDHLRNEIVKVQDLFYNCFQAFSKGEESKFFTLKDTLFEELNYFKHDFEFPFELEVKCKVYFALYYLTPMYNGTGDVESLIQATTDKLHYLKDYFNQHGSSILKSKQLKGYMQIPFIKVNKLHENKILASCTEEVFVRELLADVELELEKILAFLAGNNKHQTFLVKMYDYYLNNNENAADLQQ